jgi:glycosyltransferase EpsF
MGLGLTSFDSLDNSIDSWCTKVIEAVNMERHDPKIIYDEISSRGYNIKNNIENWVGLYGASG